jgi:UDP-N-acetylmuramate: L-alanyl-gamma-D-glutamyl-meso-diaminopimelate ligase
LAKQNRLNALAALAAARHAGVPVVAGLTALTGFEGIRRRLELRGSGRRRHRLRRLRAPSDGHRDDG